VIRVRRTKTDAADRTVRTLPLLRDELLAYGANRTARERDALVFSTSGAGGRVHRRAQALTHQHSAPRPLPRGEKANQALREAGKTEMPADLTPHSLRRTFASILVALGTDIAVTMRQIGHTTPAMTLGV
jgi:integrase